MGSICGLGRKKVGHDLATKQQQHFKLHICHPFQNKISVSVIRIGHSLVFVFLFLFKLKYYPGPTTGKGVKDLPSPLSRIIHQNSPIQDSFYLSTIYVNIDFLLEKKKILHNEKWGRMVEMSRRYFLKFQLFKLEKGFASKLVSKRPHSRS